jgi:hypothetical protein
MCLRGMGIEDNRMRSLGLLAPLTFAIIIGSVTSASAAVIDYPLTADFCSVCEGSIILI